MPAGAQGGPSLLCRQSNLAASVPSLCKAVANATVTVLTTGNAQVGCTVTPPSLQYLSLDLADRQQDMHSAYSRRLAVSRAGLRHSHRYLHCRC